MKNPALSPPVKGRWATCERAITAQLRQWPLRSLWNLCLLVGQKRTPPLKPPRLHRPLKISEAILEVEGHIPTTGLNEVENKEAEPKGEKVDEVGGSGRWR